MSFRISIVINNYNYARYLALAIDSALQQTYPHVEVIVVDDGSTDESRDIIASYGGRVRSILQENGGQASAMNAGFAASRGDIVIFLDADDLLAQDCAEQVVHRWNPECVKLSWRLRVVDASGIPADTTVPPRGVRMPRGEVRSALLRYGYYHSPPTSGNAFSRAFLSRVLPMPTSFAIAADSYLLTVAAFAGSVEAIDEPLGDYRIHGSNLWVSSAPSPERLRRRLAHDLERARLIERLLEEQPDGTQPKPRSIDSMYVHMFNRVASFVIDRAAHPFPEDTPWTLARRGALAASLHPAFGPLRRVLWSGWFLVVCVLPSHTASNLVNWTLRRSRGSGLRERRPFSLTRVRPRSSTHP